MPSNGVDQVFSEVQETLPKSTFLLCANSRERATSDGPAQRTITAGCRSPARLKIKRAASYSGPSGVITWLVIFGSELADRRRIGGSRC